MSLDGDILILMGLKLCALSFLYTAKSKSKDQRKRTSSSIPLVRLDLVLPTRIPAQVLPTKRTPTSYPQVTILPALTLVVRALYLYLIAGGL